MFDQLPSTQHKAPSLPRLGRHLNTVCMLSTHKNDWLVNIIQGKVVEVRQGPLVMPSYTFRIIASEGDWLEFLEPVPRPGRHDIIALLRRGVLHFEGDLQPLMSHLLYFKLLLASLRSPENSA